MKNLKVGVSTVCNNEARAWLERTVLAEREGIDCAWFNNGPTSLDAMVMIGAAALQTQRIELGTAVMMTFPRHPLALTQSAIAIDQLAPGRLRLGVGPSHKPFIEGIFGMRFDKPLEHLREYLTILRSLLQGGEVSFTGQRVSTHAKLTPPGATRVRVLAGALRPNAFRLCGELTDGAISWMCPLPYLRDVAAPALQEGARLAGRAAPPLIGHVIVSVCEDAKAVRDTIRPMIAFYPTLPFYAQMLHDAGYDEIKEGRLSDRTIDDFVIHGSAEQVKARLRQLPAFGVDELLATVVEPPSDPQTYERTVRALGELARES